MKMKNITFNMILLMRLNLKRFYIQIQYLFLIRILSPDGPKSLLMQLEMVLEIQKKNKVPVSE